MEISECPILSSGMSVKHSYKHVFDSGTDSVIAVLQAFLFSRQ